MHHPRPLADGEGVNLVYSEVTIRVKDSSTTVTLPTVP
jgi:hypothetical protein